MYRVVSKLSHISHPNSTPSLVASPLQHCPHFYRSASQTPWSFPTRCTSTPKSMSPTTPTDVCVCLCVCITSRGEDKTTRKVLPWWHLWNPRHASVELRRLSRSLQLYNSPSPPSYSETQALTQSCKSSMFFSVVWMSSDWIMIVCR